MNYDDFLLLQLKIFISILIPKLFLIYFITFSAAPKKYFLISSPFSIQCSKISNFYYRGKRKFMCFNMFFIDARSFLLDRHTRKVIKLLNGSRETSVEADIR